MLTDPVPGRQRPASLDLGEGPVDDFRQGRRPSIRQPRQCASALNDQAAFHRGVSVVRRHGRVTVRFLTGSPLADKGQAPVCAIQTRIHRRRSARVWQEKNRSEESERNAPGTDWRGTHQREAGYNRGRHAGASAQYPAPAGDGRGGRARAVADR